MADYEDKEFEDFDELPPESLDMQNDQDDDDEEPTAKPSTSRKTAQDWARDKRMSADVNGTTVGVATDRVTPELLLATSKKLLSVSRREAQPDQKDSLQFQRVYGPAEYFAEHVLRDGGKLGRNLLWKATNRGNLDFMQPGALDKHVTDVFYDSKLANMVDGSSPLELMDGAVKVTRLGEGGVGDTDSAPVEMRLVQPSFAGFVDPVRCYSPDTEILTESGWVRVDRLNRDHRPAVLLDGETKFAPMEKDVFVQSYPGTLHVYDDGVVSFIVTPGHRMHVRIGGEADYRIVYMSELLGILEKEPVFVRTGLEDNAEHRLSPDRFQLAAWAGDVFCPTVPGGLVYCRRNQGQGFWCGNSVDSFRIGLDAYFAKGLIKGSDGKLYRKMLNARTGKEELVDSVTAAKSVVTTPDMMESNTSSVYALGGDTGARIVDRKDVDYVLPRPDEMFSTAANVVPMLSGVKEMRLHMGCLHPSTPVVVYRKGWVDVIRACDMGNSCETIGVDDDVEKMLPVRNTVSRFPTSRNCFRAVRLLSGRSLVTSDSHRWKVQRNGKWMLVTADKLKEGDVVLRSLYSSVPTRRPFVLGKYVTADFAYALGLACRSLALTEKGKGTPRLECPADRIDAVVSALESIGECQVAKYNHNGVWLVRVEAGELADWLAKNVGVTKETRKVPSCILSAGMMQAAAFIQGFTVSPDKSALDQEEDAWILGIDNSILRDGVAIVLSRLYTDTLYRDSREHGLCLQLQPLEADYSNMAVDVVKSVTKEKAAAYMVDVDVDDRLFATANGIVTHNSKYALQAVPLDKPAPQLVRSLDEESGKDMPSLIGKYLGALYAKKGGKVVAVRKDRIDVVYDDGSKASVPLYVNFPMNQKGYISSRPVVKAGQAFGKGDILAASNWTDDKGTAAIGTPLRTAWLSWKGGTYEDGLAISQSCAEKLRSTTMYSTSMDLDKTVRLGRNSFTSWKPDAFSKEQLENIGDDGIVKPGTVLKPGDPMILAVQTTEPGPGTLGKRILTDVSEKWEHDRPGVVTDVVRTRTGVKVLTTVSSPVEVGDKLSGCFDDKTEIFTDRGFKLFKDLEKTDKIAVLQEDGTARFELPLAYQADHYKGCMIEYRTRKVSMSVTPNHNVAFVPRYNYELGDTRLFKKAAAVVYGSRVYMQVSANFIRELSDRAEGSITLPRYAGEIKIDQYREQRLVNEFSRLDFAAFLGIYLAEGHCANKGGQHWIRISQYDNVKGGEERCLAIAALLDRMGIEWHYYDHQCFMLSNWPIHKYVSKLGGSYERYIPEEVFSCWTKKEIETLLEWFCMGDGEKTIQKGRGSRCATVSRRLADGLQRLYILVGRQSNVHSCFAENARKKRIYKISSSYNRFIEVGSKKEDWKIRDDYDGMVYCVTSSTGVVLTRRDGMVTWNGQSYGNKGVVSQIIPDDEMPQDKDGNPIDLLFSPLGLITRCYDADTEFRTKEGWKKGADVKPEDLLYTYDTRLRVWAWDKQVAPMHVSDYDGSMYRYEDGNVDFLVTPHHRIWARVLGGGYSAYLVEDIFGMDCHIPYLGNNEAHLHASGWSRETYKGKIYCPSVETGYVQIRRNGKICVLGNTNASQLHEALLGKVAHKTGKPEIIPEFYKGDLMDYVNGRLKQARLSPEDDLVDPSTGKVLKGITNGYSYIYRLKHMAESKMSARGTDKYTADETPASGSYGGGKRYGSLEVSAMVGHGAFNALQDAQQIRGQSNADFWREVRTGGIPTMPGEPFVHKKFFDTLKASGVNVRRTQKGVSVFALTDSDVKEMAGPREVRTKDTFDAKNYTPMDGGLFGKDVFGPNGDKWGYIQLDEPLPNPVMEDPITRLLRMKKGDFEAVVAGEREVDGMKSAADIKKRLSTINLEQEAEKAKKEFKSSTRSKKDDALKRYRAVEMMRRNGVNPAEYMLDRIPVLPPAYRPVSTHSGLTMVADSNYLYAQLMDARDDLRAAKDLPDEYAKEARASVYRKWKELVGLYDPENPKLKSKSIKGLLGWALGTGSSPKASAVQRKVIGASVDTVGRGVVVPDPRIKLNEIGMPEKMAFDVMAPFVQRELVRSGYTPIDAMKMVKARDPRARRELLRVMETHPLQMNRAPTLHKLSIIGARPVLVSGHAIHVNPSIVVPLAMDFDGNCVDFNSRIFLKISKSELDNVAFLDHIKSVADNSADNVLNEGKAMRVTKESKIVAHNVESNEPFYQIPIGEFPKAGVPVKDRNGADVYPVPSGLAVLSCDPVTGKSSWEKVSAFTHEAGCHTVKVTTGPKEVIITDNESLAVFDTETGRLIKVKPEDHQGRLIPQFRKDPVPFGTWGNRDLGWLFGAFLSDGWVTRSVVGYAKLEKKKRDEFVRIMRSYHDNFAVYEYAGSKGEAGKLGDSVKLHLSGPGLVSWWEETGLVPPTAVAGRTALNKEIPLNLLYVANEEMLWGFLSGLLDGDGSFSKNTARNNPRFGCRFSTSSEKLKDGVVLLCYRLGIRTSTTVTAPRNFSNTAYTVCLSTSDMKRNLDKLSCVGERELGIISEWKASPEALDKQDSVPVTAEEAAAIKREISSVGPTAQLWAGLKNKDKCIRLTRGTAMKHASLIREVAPSLWERLLNMDTVWYPVDKIEDAGIRDVYDLKVDSTKVYAVNNGLIVWDTVNLHVPVSDAAREDTRNRMFPERNLVAMRDRKIAYKPEKEYQQGLYVATRMKEGERPRIFDTLEEARAALRRGDIDVDDPIIINRK